MLKPIHKPSPYPELLESLSIHCENCCGLCCAALCFAASDGFPADKPAGVSCRHLTGDFRCAIHSRLKSCGFKGCMAFDCMGAGQKLCQNQYAGRSWRESAAVAQEIYTAFYRLYTLHQMLWYLAEAASLLASRHLEGKLHAQISRVEQATCLPSEALMALPAEEYRRDTNALLKRAWQAVQDDLHMAPVKKADGNHMYMGKDLRRKPLAGQDMSMSLLIAANLSGCSLYGVNLLGADMRDTDIRGADLRESLFLTQGQINAARGNRDTRLPPHLTYPVAWDAAP